MFLSQLLSHWHELRLPVCIFSDSDILLPDLQPLQSHIWLYQHEALSERVQITFRHAVGARAVQSILADTERELEAIASKIAEIPVVADVADKWGFTIEGILSKT